MVKKPKTAEINPGPGFRIRTNIKRPDPAIIAGLGEFETPVISDLMNRLYTMTPAIHNLTAPELNILGSACTVKVFPGDNLMVHKSLDLAAPNDIIVVDAGGSSMNAVMGDLVCTKARHRQIGGFVVDGYVRDIPGILELHFPVYARGITPIGPLHRGPGEVNFPIQCGGIVVHPGDIIVGDMNGVVVVPQEIASALLQRLRDRRGAEAEYLAAVKRGEFSNEWVDTILTEGQCEIIQDHEFIYTTQL
ncbi:MAG: RraA family protein [Ignavibacteriae bacterium]|nr:RraA family protein [Ignavibacteriota bacterium]